jgi:hypothetical protein
MPGERANPTKQQTYAGVRGWFARSDGTTARDGRPLVTVAGLEGADQERRNGRLHRELLRIVLTRPSLRC